MLFKLQITQNMQSYALYADAVAAKVTRMHKILACSMYVIVYSCCEQHIKVLT